MIRRWALAGLTSLALIGPALAGGDSQDRLVNFNKSVDVDEGQSLVVRIPEGSVYIDTWDQKSVQIRCGRVNKEAIELRTLRNILLLTGRRGYDWDDGELDITVPKWMEVSVEGQSVEVEIDGVENRIDVEIIEGDISVVGGRDRVRLRSIQGSIQVEHARGRIDVASTQDNVTVLDSYGQVIVEAINGDIRIAGVESDNTEAISFTGDILYDGTIDPRGDYYFSTHDGDINIAVGEEADVSVTVITKQGDFESDFDVRLLPMISNDRLEFMLGEGSAKLRIESFSGDVRFFDPKQGRRKRGR